MDVQEERIYHRPSFRADGALFARRELKLGDRVIAPSRPLPADHGLDARAVRTLYDLYMIDTYPPGTVAFSANHGERVEVEPRKGKRR
jgi:hypothetical protein